MPQSLLRGQRQDSRSRHHNYSIPSPRGDAWGVREGVWNTTEQGSYGLCCCAAVFGAIERLCLPRCVETQIQTTVSDADMSENGAPFPSEGRSENDIRKNWLQKKYHFRVDCG